MRCRRRVLVTANGSTTQTRVHRDEVSPPARYANELAHQWNCVHERLQAVVGEAKYRTWLQPMMLAQINGDEATVYLPTRFLRDWVRSHYGRSLQRDLARRTSKRPQSGYPGRARTRYGGAGGKARLTG